MAFKGCTAAIAITDLHGLFNPFATTISFFVDFCVCPTIIILLLFPIRLPPHSRVAHRHLDTPSHPNENLKYFKMVLKSTVGSERVKGMR